MTLEQRKIAKTKLRTTYGARLTTVIAGRTGYSGTYVREWFRTEVGQPEIERTVLSLLNEQFELITNAIR